MKNKNGAIKVTQIRLPHELWMFLKLDAIDKCDTMHGIMINTLYKYKKRIQSRSEKDLTTI